jgi:hypothetical protein
MKILALNFCNENIDITTEMIQLAKMVAMLNNNTNIVFEEALNSLENGFPNLTFDINRTFFTALDVYDKYNNKAAEVFFTELTKQ